MNLFFQHLSKYGRLKPELNELFEKKLRLKVLDKDEMYLREGEHEKHICFVEQGLLSYYFLDREGNMVIKKFFSEGEFVASLSSVVSKMPSKFVIQALETCRLWELPYDYYRELMKTHLDLALLQINYLEQRWVLQKEMNEIKLKATDAKVRYLEFLKSYPHLKNRLRQHQIASYLGVTPTQLSRIRAQLSDNKEL
ncbi:Crp/Fnr family transcriptional regulator [Rapidithrix thailandica]|uniref:Crp/Fnr family transcriptional regulator n=1 Tax=Rapidithrix thailandica TaxID=413964 RepID=A0AAW9SEJ1_9BACT